MDAAHDRSETYTLESLYRLKGAKGLGNRRAGLLADRQSARPFEHVPPLNAGTIDYGHGAGPHALTASRGARLIAYDALGRMTSDGERPTPGTQLRIPSASTT